MIPERNALALWRGDASDPPAEAATPGQSQEQVKSKRIWWYAMLLVFAAALAESLCLPVAISARNGRNHEPGARNPSSTPISEKLERRLRLRHDPSRRQSAVIAAAALLTTLFLVLIISHFFAFSSPSLVGARFVLFAILAAAAGFSLAIPLSRLNRLHAVGRAEQTFPQFQQRLVTFAERDPEGRNPFIELLAADTLDAAQEAGPVRLGPTDKLLASLGVGIASLGVLIWMVAAGPGVLGYGASLLWTGNPRRRGVAPSTIFGSVLRATLPSGETQIS